jgi:predicted RecB family nuclease
LQDIIDYNEDDVIATEFLHKWLVEQGGLLQAAPVPVEI